MPESAQRVGAALERILMGDEEDKDLERVVALLRIQNAALTFR